MRAISFSPRLLAQEQSSPENNGERGSLSTSRLAFGNQTVGTQSAPLTITFKSTGTSPLVIHGIFFQGLEFLQTNNCRTQMVPGDSWVIQIVFTPVSAGPADARLYINCGAQNNNTAEAKVALTGNGTSD